MLLNNGGHYEMADEIENSQVSMKTVIKMKNELID